MDDDSLFFEVKTIGLSTYKKRKPQTLLDAVRHNRRQIQAELGAGGRIDPTRTHLNQTLCGADIPASVVELARALMAATGHVPTRRDYTQAIELVFSLPASSAIDLDAFFGDCLRWVGAQFGGDVILTGDVHRDEKCPHMHVLLAPIASGRYVGSKLITRVELAKLRESFAALALTHGLREPVRRLHGARREEAARLVLDYLESTRDPLLQSALWFTVKTDITSNPARYVARLGIALPEQDAPAKKVKTMAQIFTSKGKGAKSERNQKPIGFELAQTGGAPKPIGFEIGHAIDPQNIETIPVLVSPKNTPPFQPPTDPTATPSTDAPCIQPTTSKGSELAPATTPEQPLSAIPNADGEIAAPAVAKGEISNATLSRGSPNSQGHPLAKDLSSGRHLVDGQSGADLEDLTDQEQGETTRERDRDQDAGAWCEQTGDFIRVTPAPTRAARTSVEALVSNGVLARGRLPGQRTMQGHA